MVSRRSLVHLLVALTLAATWSCSGGGGDAPSSDSPTVPATVEEALARSAGAMAAVHHAAFELRRTGAEVALDPDGRLVFDAADGRYAAPASADAVVQVTAGGLRTRVRAVAIDGETWITNPLSGRWEEAPAGLSFDPAILFDAETGWPDLLREGLSDAELSGGDDGGRHLVRGTVDADRVSTLTGGLADEPTDVELWLETATGRVVECQFEVPTADGPSAWVLELRDYDEAVTIERPVLGSTG